MKRRIRVAIVEVFVFGIMLCGCSMKSENLIMDEIGNSATARLETANGDSLYVDSEIDVLKSFAGLEIQQVPMEPVDDENDWIYRVVFNPSEKASGSTEIIVSFHENYVQIGSEYYLPKSGVEYSSILEWAESKMDYFLNSVE